jgi:hypothetical protein
MVKAQRHSLREKMSVFLGGLGDQASHFGEPSSVCDVQPKQINGPAGAYVFRIEPEKAS